MTIEQFMELQRNHMRQVTLERYRQLNRFARKGQYLFAGSSLAEQFPVNELLLADPDAPCLYNRGVSGDVMEQFIQDMDTLVFDLEPTKLFINIGSNDIGLEGYQEDLHMQKYIDILDKLQLRLPDTQIHVLSYYPVNPDIRSFIPETEKAKLFMTRNMTNINALNHRLQAHCKEQGLTYIDVSSVLMDESGSLREDFTMEGIHLWPNAYFKVLEVLKAYF